MEASFQLSFMAVLSIAAGIRIFRRTSFMQPPDTGRKGVLQRYRPALLLSVLVPVFASLGTGPIVAHHFGTLSLAGLIANPLLVPLAGFIIVPAGLLTGFVCLFAASGSAILASVLDPVAAFFLWTVDLLAGLPMAAFTLPRPAWSAVGASYVLIAAAVAWVHRILRRTP